MATRLPSGLKVWNATPHPLFFLCEGGEVVAIESHGIINAVPVTKEVKNAGIYTLNTVRFVASSESLNLLVLFQEEEPDALVVGSIIAAQAYPGEVVAPIPVQRGRLEKALQDKRLMRSDRFTVFQSKENNNGSR